MADTPFKLGSVTFLDFEVPERLPDVGVRHAIALKEFPGGKRTIQSFGTFPKAIVWEGQLRGETALQRHHELERLAQQQEVVELSWASIKYKGTIKDYHSEVHYKWEIFYRIEFEPVASTQTSLHRPVTSPQEMMAQANNVLSQQSLTPASGATLPATVTSGVSNFQGQLTATLSQYGGHLMSVPATVAQSLKSLVQSVRGTLSSLISNTSGDPQMASAAKDLDYTLRIFEALLDQKKELLYEARYTNPNLFQLAATFYGDASLWTLIADVNRDVLGGSIDPQPLGTFTLKIPANPNVKVADIAVFQ